eukprot:269891_1
MTLRKSKCPLLLSLVALPILISMLLYFNLYQSLPNEDAHRYPVQTNETMVLFNIRRAYTNRRNRIKNSTIPFPPTIHINIPVITPTPVASQDNQTMSSICRNQSIVFLGNHKTGSQLFCKALHRIAKSFFKERCLPGKNINIIHMRNHVSGEWIRDYMFQWMELNQTHPRIVLNIIRSPVDTVLSGYNYHKTTNEVAIGQTPLNLKKYKRNFYFFICEPILEMVHNAYGNSTLKDIYNNHNVSFGIDLEYHRYNHCEYVRIHGSYRMMQYTLKEHMHLHTFRLEDLRRDFKQSMQRLLNSMLIFDAHDREMLMSRFLRAGNEQKKNKRHVTQGTYNRTQQIDILLRNLERCNMLKQQTVSLDYQWRFQEYC